MVQSQPLRISGPTTVREMVYDKLREAIVCGFFRPGQRLRERDLERELGVSRTPIREAIRQLELERLVVSAPYRGVVVAELSRQEAEEVYQVRAALEGLVSRLAAQRATPDSLARIEEALVAFEQAVERDVAEDEQVANRRFHRAIAEASGHRLAQSLLQRVEGYMGLLSAVTLVSRSRPADSRLEHRAIFQAIADGDAERAYQAAVDHVSRMCEAARQELPSR